MKKDKRFFLTVEWCGNGHRGILCETGGGAFSKESQHSQEDIIEPLGRFWMILNPKSEQFSEEEIKEFTKFVSLAEYKHQYGIALKAK